MCIDSHSTLEDEIFWEQTNLVLHSLMSANKTPDADRCTQLPVSNHENEWDTGYPIVTYVGQLVNAFRREYHNQLESMLEIFKESCHSTVPLPGGVVSQSVLCKIGKCITQLLSREAVSWGRIIAVLALFCEIRVCWHFAKSPPAGTEVNMEKELLVLFRDLMVTHCGAWIRKNGGWDGIYLTEKISGGIETGAIGNTPANTIRKMNMDNVKMLRFAGFAALGMGICSLVGLVAIRL
ncbi:uncharacterized protein LOC129589243 [Paramacrobiotus metropolitanus]|uniref:uncharacterized protein LOC129589243 n=1 Tax=Paramacrobiotus metropolitanus TaxID=2943436 RepID=UPI0024456AF1|nr:uncharacterized protein LOC129589243 [Paramacrobiotus metropolitanus]